MLAATKDYDEEVVIQKLKDYCNTFPTKGEAASALGVGRVFLWRVLERKVRPTNAMLERIGFKVERVISYVYREVPKDA